VSYQVSDSLGRAATSTITPTVTAPPITAVNDTSSGLYDTNQTISPLVNDTPGAEWVPTSVRLCDTNQIAPNCTLTSLTVPGEGTYTVNADGTVTFDPLPTFTGTATPVAYQATDVLGRTATAEINVSVGSPPVPTASPEAISDAYDTNQTYTPLSNDTPGAPSFPLLAGTVLLCGPGQQAPACDKTTLTVTGQGTYEVDPTTGAVTFDPLPTFTGPATPISYQAKDSLNRAVTSTISPTVGVPPVPTASPEAISDAYDTNQAYTPLSNDTPGAVSFPLLATTVLLCGTGQTAPACDKTSLTVPNQGTYTVNTTTGEVLFDPLPTFTGTATPVSYQGSDSLGRTATSTITPTVGLPPVPTASPEAITDAYDTNQTYTPISNDSAGAPSFPLLVTTVLLCGTGQTAPACDKTSLTVPNQGTYTVNPTTGAVVFDPLPTFTGIATAVSYQVSDSLGRAATSTITPTVTAPPITAVDDFSSDAYDTNHIISPLLNDIPGAAWVPASVRLCDTNQIAPNCDKTSLTVDGEGTYTVNADGTVTFDPLPTFTGTATPVAYQATDILNRTATADITPSVGLPPVPTASPEAITDVYDTNQTYTPLSNDTPGAPSFPLLAGTVLLCGVGQTAPACDKTSLTVPNQGTYTVNPSTGAVVFDPLPTFTGAATPVSYQGSDSLGRTATSTISPTVGLPPVPNASPEAISDAYDTNQVYTPISNDTPGAVSFPLLATTVLLCGPGQTAPNCTLTSLTVPNQGTYTVNTTTGEVTFDPLPTFTGAATPISYQSKDSLNRAATSTISPTVGLPPVPTASPEAITDAYDTNQTYTPLSNDAPGVASFPLLPSSVLLCATTETAPNCTLTSLTTPNQGTYTVNPTTGAVVFDPLPTFTGTATAVSYQAKDALNRSVTSTITPTVTAPPITAVDDVSRNAFDTNQVISPLTNDIPSAPWNPASVRLCGTGETAPNCTLTSLTVPNEGTYTVNSNGTVTFDPEATYTGTATPVVYQATDILGRTATAQITPTVDPPARPAASPETRLLLPGATSVFTRVVGMSALATGAGLQTGATSGPCLMDPSNNSCVDTVTIQDEGTWTIDQTTGVASFAALPTIAVGTHTPVVYRVTDVLGQTATSTLTPIIPPPPSAKDDAITTDYDVTQTYTPFANDTFSSIASVVTSTLRLCASLSDASTCTATTLVVPNEGTFTVNANGTVTFDPLPTFEGTATPVRYQASDIVGQTVTATLNPIILAPPLPSANIDTASARENRTITFTPWLNDSPGPVSASGGETLAFVPTSLRLCPLGTVSKTGVVVVPTAIPACTLTKLTTKDGTYTVDIKTGKVSFVHRKRFVGTAVEPVMYQLGNTWKGPFGPAFTTSLLIPTIVPSRVPAASVGDWVWRDVKGDGLQNRKDWGISGVLVTLRTIDGREVTDLFGNTVKPQRTDKKGKYRFDDLPEGQYVVSVRYPKGLYPTTADRPGRSRNSSTTRAVSRYLRLGQHDGTLDFGMVGRNPSLPTTK
jgi:CshA-type fibril repeat protein